MLTETDRAEAKGKLSENSLFAMIMIMNAFHNLSQDLERDLL